MQENTSRKIVLAACMSLCACQMIPTTNTPQPEPTQVVAPNATTKIDFYYSVDAQCTSRGVPEAFIVEDGKNGTFAALAGKDFPNFTPTSPYNKCNGAQTPGVFVLYTPSQGYVGTDGGIIAIRFPGDAPSDPMTKFHYNISVKNASAEKPQESAAPAPAAPPGPAIN